MSKTGGLFYDKMMAEGAAEYVAQQAQAEQERRQAAKRPCYCFAYPFPHRKGGGKCKIHAMQAAVVERGGWISDEDATSWLYDYSDSVDRAANAYMEDYLSLPEEAIYF